MEIVEHEAQTSACKALEAFWIYSTDPKVSRKGDGVHIYLK